MSYSSKKRFSHSAPVVGDNVYVWAGAQPDSPEEHDSSHKRQYSSCIDIFTVPSGQWSSQRTSGTPPLGITEYRCTVINSNIYFFGGYCGHDICYHNHITVLDTLTLKWTQLKDNVDFVMKRASGGLLAVELMNGDQYLFTVGGLGSTPTHYQPQFQYHQYPSGLVRTNECNLFSLSTGKCSLL